MSVVRRLSSDAGAPSDETGGGGPQTLHPLLPPPLPDPILAQPAPRRRYSNCCCIAVFLLALAGLVAVLSDSRRNFLRAQLCAHGIPSFKQQGQRPPLQLVAHRGSEWPFPENSLPALARGAQQLMFVELDLTQTSDNEVVIIHDETLRRTVLNSSKDREPVCRHSLADLQSLTLSMPSTKPAPDSQPPKAVKCEAAGRMAGQGCPYRIPTLEQVFKYMPQKTRFMLDVKVCSQGTSQASSSAMDCNPCSTLVSRTKHLMSQYGIDPSATVFASTDVASLASFSHAFPSASFALSLDLRYGAYTGIEIVEILDKHGFSSAAMYYGLAALRPDLVSAVRQSANPRTRKLRDVYAWTVRRESQARLAACAGVDSFIVADPAFWSDHSMVRAASCPG